MAGLAQHSPVFRGGSPLSERHPQLASQVEAGEVRGRWQKSGGEQVGRAFSGFRKRPDRIRIDVAAGISDRLRKDQLQG
jgi:hypothetical protein